MLGMAVMVNSFDDCSPTQKPLDSLKNLKRLNNIV
jgi:hypothetical protein